jgi:hypothetical protein
MFSQTRRIVSFVSGKQRRPACDHWPNYGRSHIRGNDECYSRCASAIGFSSAACPDADFSGLSKAHEAFLPSLPSITDALPQANQMAYPTVS